MSSVEWPWWKAEAHNWGTSPVRPDPHTFVVFGADVHIRAEDPVSTLCRAHFTAPISGPFPVEDMPVGGQLCRSCFAESAQRVRTIAAATDQARRIAVALEQQTAVVREHTLVALGHQLIGGENIVASGALVDILALLDGVDDDDLSDEQYAEWEQAARDAYGAEQRALQARWLAQDRQQATAEGGADA